MINILLGAPGGGKSYEAVVFHILPMLAMGRKIITNMPLNIDEFAAIDPSYKDLIEIRTQTLAKRPEMDWKKAEENYKKYGLAAKPEHFNTYPFSHLEDYGDKWRHPESGAGPFYVIDECHIGLPKIGTLRQVEEWYSMHRHESADVLLITQSHSKINRAIKELIQVCYKVRKNTALGSQTSYVKKVQDGLNGAVVNTSIRKYKPEFFKFYRSHTRGGGSELAAKDIKPIWQNWTFMGFGVCMLILVGMGLTGNLHAPWDAAHTSNKIVPPPVVSPVSAPVFQPSQAAFSSSLSGSHVQPLPASQSQSVSQQKPVDVVHPHPFQSLTIHIEGHIHSYSKRMYLIALAQNGQLVQHINNMELIQAGYKFEPISDCTARVKYNDFEQVIVCDSPRVGLTMPTNTPNTRSH
jgi:zona occludens toxin